MGDSQGLGIVHTNDALEAAQPDGVVHLWFLLDHGIFFQIHQINDGHFLVFVVGAKKTVNVLFSALTRLQTLRRDHGP